MKKSLFTLGLIAFLSLAATSCSNDDSVVSNDKNSEIIVPDNGDRELPKPPRKP